MKIALAQINPTIGAFTDNTRKMASLIDKAKGLSCDLIVFPELVISGYPPLDLLERNDFVNANIKHLDELVDSVKGIGVICGFVDRNRDTRGKPLHNAAILFENGSVLHQVHKRLLPNYDVFDENRYFKPGKKSSCCLYKGYRLGLTICEDIWNDVELYPRQAFSRRLYPIDPVADLIKDGANLIINISSSPFWIGKTRSKHEMLGNLAKKYQTPLLYINQAGGNDSLLFDGVSMAFDSQGQIAARGLDFEEDFILFDTDTQKGDIHQISKTEAQSVLKALIMGTRDYVQKCGFSSVLVGLSGGIDSALTVCIAVEAVGKENVTGVFMPSQFTSHASHKDTENLAENLGIRLIQIPITDIFDQFLHSLTPVFKDISTEITGQNIQARIRGTTLMALSNKLGGLVLSTGNKSELAVGYCTLYGDMVGGLAVISDVPKTMVYELAKHINNNGEIIPNSILNKAPSAELKPDQADEDDLPSYEILDKISRLYIEENRGLDKIISTGLDPTAISETIYMIDRSEYKRYQAPPALKVTTKSFGHGRRYPIARKYLSTSQN